MLVAGGVAGDAADHGKERQRRGNAPPQPRPEQSSTAKPFKPPRKKPTAPPAHHPARLPTGAHPPESAAPPLAGAAGLPPPGSGSAATVPASRACSACSRGRRTWQKEHGAEGGLTQQHLSRAPGWFPWQSLCTQYGAGCAPPALLPPCPRTSGSSHSRRRMRASSEAPFSLCI